MGRPIPEGNLQFFTYQSWAGYTDSGGTEYRILFDSNVGAEGTFDGANLRIGFAGGAECAFTWINDDLEIAQQANENFVGIFSAANFKESDPEVCTTIFQIIKHDGVRTTMSPIINLNMGE